MSNTEKDYLDTGKQYFKAKKYVEAIEQVNLALQCEDATLEQQISCEWWLGRCYFEQDLFDEARAHFKEYGKLAEKLEDEQERIKKQAITEFWLGHCYFEQDLFGKARAHFKENGKFAGQLEDGQERIKKQATTELWLGRTYFEQDLFDEARAHFKEYGKLAEKLEDGQERIKKQAITELWLGHTYFEQDLFDEARAHFKEYGKLAEKFEDEQERIKKQATTALWLGHSYLEQGLFDEAREHFKAYAKLDKPSVNEPLLSLELILLCECNELANEKNAADEYEKYLDEKAKSIEKELPSDSDNELKTAIAQILAVLNITPVELYIPLAHYTTPTVCEKLLGLVKNNDDNKPNEPSAMRMNSCTYMNDPTEGQSLLALLNMQNLSLKNKIDFEERKPYNAFFSCFSKRINDLNQFRLYGKEESVEASGCCLLFNKTGNWLQSSNISSSFSLGGKQRQSNELLDEADGDDGFNKKVVETYPLYQVAYIAYDDEYLPQNVCQISLESNNRTFFVYLPSLFFNTEPDRLRETRLQKGLEKLIKYVSDSTDSEEKNSAEKNHELLEYVRYLFKDFAFRDEEEFRALTVCSLEDEQVKSCNCSNGLYVEYGNIHHQIDEIILGTNYEYTKQKRKVEVLRYKLAKSNLKVKVSHSTLPITPPTL